MDIIMRLADKDYDFTPFMTLNPAELADSIMEDMRNAWAEACTWTDDIPILAETLG